MFRIGEMVRVVGWKGTYNGKVGRIIGHTYPYNNIDFGGRTGIGGFSDTFLERVLGSTPFHRSLEEYIARELPSV